MAAMTRHLSYRRSNTTLWVGLGIIAFASIRNLILARIAPAKLGVIPTLTPESATENGRLAITLALVAIGIVVLLWHEIVAVFLMVSWWLGRDRIRSEPADEEPKQKPPRIRYDYVQGGVCLQTAKYLPRGSHPDFSL